MIDTKQKQNKQKEKFIVKLIHSLLYSEFKTF